MEQKESITKSIVYGNPYKNNYGVFLPLCSAISSKHHVSKVIDYLHANKFFVKYDRYAYAYRVDDNPLVFITEKRNEESKFEEGSFNDETIEGAGDKLLHLLQKLNVRNVLIVVIIEQFDPLRRFDTSNYRVIVENSKELLNTLYKKVLKTEQNKAKKQHNLILDNQKTLVIKKTNINEAVILPDVKKSVPKQRPNHIYSEAKPNFLIKQKPHSSSSVNARHKGSEIRFLQERIQTFTEQLAKLAQTFQEKDYEHLKFMATYDKNPLVNSVFRMVEVIEDLTREQCLQGYDFSRVKNISADKLDKRKMRKLADMVISNRNLNLDNVMKISKSLGVVFSMIELIMRSFKAQKRIQSLNAEKEAQETV